MSPPLHGDTAEGATLLQRGRLRVRHAQGAADLAAAQALRGIAFHGGGADIDPMDPVCRHVLVEASTGGAPLACFRYLWLTRGAEIERSYSAQYYDLGRLAGFDAPLLELGRFCIRPGASDPDILRLSWAAITALVDRGGAGMLFGCASFHGTDPTPLAPALSYLAGHVAPERWQVGRKAPETVAFESCAAPRDGLKLVPPLLRTYLSMGGWVSDHAVVDRAMGTLHVFTGVEVAAIPPARARALRALAG
ncbi:GNAT family N-acyltransferase [Salipiger sp. 1_MG-2023]|uniref:GNAT family N-acetyltransferase n=1 Tax=Salipiger sp. 1_MG-2023 TaxID=3062665 RepID=UPI0026E1B231|nr:GNAT family N-acetyltransferase [Salipiger sp. 1_MG-2023]MDO6585787.1 GNAT family N-acyltransferase [Salipiger sp. 1_MG-2023]